jgi:hypothetical protein
MKTDLQTPTNLNEFFHWLKKESEKQWENIEINKVIYGFQLQKGTKWLPGLTDAQITEYEKLLGFGFPEIYKMFLKCMNGMDKETINVYGESGESYKYGVGYYSYPRDINTVKENIDWICKEFKTTQQELDKKEIPHIVPIVSHRFLVMDRCETNPVLSMYGNDVVPYADSLNNFLFYSIFSEFGESGQQPNLPNLKVKFWLD